jgi:hypothetical protein
MWNSWLTPEAAPDSPPLAKISKSNENNIVDNNNNNNNNRIEESRNIPPSSPISVSATPSRASSALADIALSPSNAAKKPVTEEVKAERHAKALNSILESIFLFSIRKSSNTAILPLDIDEDTANYYNIISKANLSELLCIKLSGSLIDSSSVANNNNAIYYLYGCYRRLIAKESSVPTEQLKTDLLE